MSLIWKLHTGSGENLPSNNRGYLSLVARPNNSKHERMTMSIAHPRAVIRFLTCTCLKPLAIFTELYPACDKEPMKLSTAKKWHLRFLDGYTSQFDALHSDSPPRSDGSGLIQSLSEKYIDFMPSYLSKNEDCKINLLVYCSWWSWFEMVSYMMSASSVGRRSGAGTRCFSTQLLKVLEDAENDDFHHIITSDENCVFLDYFHDSY
jgi:hypothetical protein